MKQLCRASSYYQLRIGRTVKVATRTREARNGRSGEGTREPRDSAARVRVVKVGKCSVKLKEPSSRVAARDESQCLNPVGSPTHSSQALFRRAPVDQLELLPGPMRNVPRHAGPRSALRLRSAVSAYTRLNAMANGNARRAGGAPINVLIIPRNSRKKPVLTTLNCSSDVLLTKPLTDVSPPCVRFPHSMPHSHRRWGQVRGLVNSTET